MKDLPTLKSETLLLRPFILEDASTVQKLAGNKRVSDTTANVPYPYDDGLAESWISTHESRWKNGEGLTYAVALIESNILVGAVGFVTIINAEAELGYWIGVPYWGKGYCTEAVKLLVNFSFDDLGLKRVYAKHLARNPASGRVLVKAGFAHIGSTFEECRKHEGQVEIEEYEKFNT